MSGRAVAVIASAVAAAGALLACATLAGLEDSTLAPTGGDDAAADAMADVPDASADGAGDSVTCAQCDDRCVDLRSDPANCGACGATCADGGYACFDASCAPAVQAIAAGIEHACALLEDGSVWCWGHGVYGQLGVDPTTLSTSCSGVACSSVPVHVAGLPPIARIAAGGESTCAVDMQGALYCWGLDDALQLGHPPAADGTCSGGMPCRYQPTALQGLSKVKRVAVGQRFACAIAAPGGTVYCWGDNTFGQLGAGQAGGSRYAPTGINMPGDLAAVEIYAPVVGNHVCAIEADGSLACWGGNTNGELGEDPNAEPMCGTIHCLAAPAHVAGLSNVTSAQLGLQFTCVNEGAPTAECIGMDTFGQFGGGNWDTKPHPAPQPGVSAAYSAIAAGHASQCAIALDASVACWGLSTYGSIGGGTIDGSACATDHGCEPSPVRAEVPRGTAAVAMGFASAYAIAGDKTVWAWGLNDFGELGHAPASSGDRGDCGGTLADAGASVCNPSPTRIESMP